MRIKVLVEKESFRQSSSLPHISADAHSLINAAPLCSEREMTETEEGKVQKIQRLFLAQLEQTRTGKAVSCVNIGNIVNNSRL